MIENCHWGGDLPTQDWCPFNFFRTSGVCFVVFCLCFCFCFVFVFFFFFWFGFCFLFLFCFVFVSFLFLLCFLCFALYCFVFVLFLGFIYFACFWFDFVLVCFWFDFVLVCFCFVFVLFCFVLFVFIDCCWCCRHRVVLTNPSPSGHLAIMGPVLHQPADDAQVPGPAGAAGPPRLLGLPGHARGA